MSNVLPKEVKCSARRIIEVSKDCRYLRLEDGSVVDTVLSPTLFHTKEDPIKCLFVAWGGFRLVMSKSQFEPLFYAPEANFDFDEVESLIQKTQYIAQANLTICILTISDSTAFCGVFNEVHTCGMTETEKEYAAYLNALKELTSYFIHRRNEQMSILESA